MDTCVFCCRKDKCKYRAAVQKMRAEIADLVGKNELHGSIIKIDCQFFDDLSIAC